MGSFGNFDTLRRRPCLETGEKESRPTLLAPERGDPKNMSITSQSKEVAEYTIMVYLKP